MSDAVSEGNLAVLVPVILGGMVGILALSHLLSWVYKRFKDQTIAILTGFILGSLSILWPWKTEIYRLNSLGEFILKDGNKIVQGYDLFIPDSLSFEVVSAIFLAIVGFIIIALMERFANKERE